MKICRYCNSPVMTIPDKSSPIKKVPHVRNWGAKNLVYSYSMCYTKTIKLDVCHYHNKNREKQKLVNRRLRRLRRSR